MARGRRVLVYGIGLGVWLTGGLWLVFHYFIRSVDEFGFAGPSPLERRWLVAHAAFAVAAVWIFGLLWPSHIKPGWAIRMQRPAGGTLFAVIAWLILSGFALYYIGASEWRSWTSVSHWAVGLAAIAVFVVHLLTKTPIHRASRPASPGGAQKLSGQQS
jgi:hypothetical protein